MTADRAPDSFGAKLRAARERRGVTLRQIANATKISVGVLEALERNDISRLPGGIFSRAFVRSYAIEVGLEPEETIREFLGQFPHDSVTAGHRSSQATEDNDAVENSRRMATTFIWLVIISLPIVGIIMFYEGKARNVAPPPSQAQPAVAVTPPVAPRAVAATPVPEPAPAPAPAPVTPAVERLTVGLSATGPCWVSVTADGQKAFERTLVAGEQQTVDVSHELVLTAGDAGAITITLNGAEAKPLGKPGQVVTARLNLANFKEYLVER